MYDAETGTNSDAIPEAIGRFSAIPRPFLKWAGSKQALLQQIAPVLPDRYGRYYEPFLGSGALFLFLKPRRATLSDASEELVRTWSAVRDHADKISNHLRPLKPNKDLFYKIRRSRSENPAENAAEFIYLNRSCWNGLYRVNSRGQFNVPFGAPKSDFIFDEDNVRACSALLMQREVTLRKSDFEPAVRQAREGDLVFFDPPYVTKHNLNGFRDWNEKLFSWADQERLAVVARRLADRGVKVVVSNADHEDVVGLYRGFLRTSLRRTSTLASDASKRGRTTEALFYTP